MALKIVKKQDKQRIVITILGGTVGNAKYWLSQDILKSDIKNLFKETSELVYQNMFDYLCKNLKSSCEILPLYTDYAKDINKEISEEKIQNGIRIDEKEFEDIFSKINNILDSEKYKDSEFIIDITHGFRHLPILATIASLIHNFKNADKIKAILFGKEIKPQDEYEIIDLKIYLDIANISFILTAFSDNYTISNHIKSPKFKDLLNALNDFSNDMMALNVGKLRISRNNLIKYLEKIDNEAIKQQAINLKIKIENLVDFNAKRSEILYKLAKDMFDKNYLLLSLAALFESTRSYIVEFMYKNNNEIMQKIEDFYKNKGDGKNYLIDKFCKNTLKFFPKNKNNVYAEFLDRTSEKDKKLELTNKEIDRILSSLKKLENRNKIVSLYEKIETKRNDLAHANSSGKAFDDIKNEVKDFLEKYENLVSWQNK
ncbi:MAG: CRISPR-associated DxTHG motif protein [Campylobacter sp.]|nr:CRISPR-associated DxTHG motif protein [Campylobacter sp.]